MVYEHNRDVVGAIRSGRHLTRDGREVYIACKCSVDRYNSPVAYPWWVEYGKADGQLMMLADT